MTDMPYLTVCDDILLNSNPIFFPMNDCKINFIRQSPCSSSAVPAVNRRSFAPDHQHKASADRELSVADPRETPIALSTVSIFGFSGDITLEYKIVNASNPLHLCRFTGHVGYSLDGGETILGFGPAVPGDIDSTEIISRLVNMETFPGKVSDDTHIFRSVAQSPFYHLSMVSAEQIVYKQDIVVSLEQFGAIKASHDARPLDLPMPEVQYGFPFPDLAAFNCATYPGTLGIPLPHLRGTLSTYIPELAEKGEKWEPSARPHLR